jgi:hypothetical protein
MAACRVPFQRGLNYAEKLQQVVHRNDSGTGNCP